MWKLELMNFKGKIISRNIDSVALDNPQNPQSTVFIGAMCQLESELIIHSLFLVIMSLQFVWIQITCTAENDSKILVGEMSVQQNPAVGGRLGTKPGT